MSHIKPKIIGIAGSFASGKDTLANYLDKKHGYFHISTGDTVRLEAQRLHGSTERPILYETANTLRHQHGAGYFVDLALQEIPKHPNATGIIVTGIRTLGEAKTIKAHHGVLLFVDTPVEVRYARMKDRNRDDEVQLTLDQFIANEQKEWYSGPNEADFNLRGIQEMADIHLHGIISKEAFFAAAEERLHLL